MKNEQTKNYKLTIAYDGTRYFGWEHQPGKDTIQGKIETVLQRMCNMNEIPEVIGAGRTDAGVHARGQIAKFRTEADMTAEQIREYVNCYLPSDIRIVRVEEAGERFHSRLNATGKTYHYRCLKKGSFDVFNRNYVMELTEEVDIETMREAAFHFLGTHDFASFCTKA